MLFDVHLWVLSFTTQRKARPCLLLDVMAVMAVTIPSAIHGWGMVVAGGIWMCRILRRCRKVPKALPRTAPPCTSLVQWLMHPIFGQFNRCTELQVKPDLACVFCFSACRVIGPARLVSGTLLLSLRFVCMLCSPMPCKHTRSTLSINLNMPSLYSTDDLKIQLIE